MNNVKELEIKIEGEKWTKALDKAFNTKKKDLKVDGFRKGACPKDIYIKKFGIESLFMDAVDLVINDAYKDAIIDNKLDPVCEPKVDVKHIDEKHVIFNFSVILHPEVKLGKYKNLDIKREDVKVSTEEVNKEIDHLRDKFADVVEINEGLVEKGNTAIIDFKGVVDGKVIDGGSGEKYPLEVGSNTFIPGFEDGIIGMSIGDEKVLHLKFPAEYVENLKDKDVDFTVKVVGIKKRILPELNESFYKDLGYTDVKDEKGLKDEVKKYLLSQKESEAENKYIDELLKYATDNIEVTINPEIIDEEVNRMVNQYKEQLKMQGLSLEQYLAYTKSNIDSLKKMMEPEATNRVKSRYLLEAVADKEKITVDDKEIKEETTNMAKHYGVSEEELLNMIGGTDAVAYDMKMRKAIELLKN